MSDATLPAEFEATLRRDNPWWQGDPGRVLPPFRRWLFATALRRLIEAPLAPIVTLRGPRQVGKSTLLEQIVRHLLDERGIAPRRILRAQFDDLPALTGLAMPILALARWFEDAVLGESFNAAAHAGRPALLFLDEVQNLPDWHVQLKHLVDHHSVTVFATGSSALEIEAGRDSLAGRVTTLELGPLLLHEIARLRFGESLAPLLADNGHGRLGEAALWRDLAAKGAAERGARDRAFAAFSERGGYPFMHVGPARPWAELADQLNETVIARVLRQDLARAPGPAAEALPTVFRLACRYAGQAPAWTTLAAEAARMTGTPHDARAIEAALDALRGSLLLRLIPAAEIALKRAGGYPKLCLADHALRASWLQEPVALAGAPDASDDAARLAGPIAESVTGAFLAGMPALDVAHFPARADEPEVDFVLTAGERRIPVEVKYRERIDPVRDVAGLRAYLDKRGDAASFGLLVTRADGAAPADPRIVALPLPSLLLLR